MLVFLLLAAVSAITIQWSGRGGTNLWDNPSNWDCSCLPSANDDVVISFSLGATNVRIGAPARAKSLTIGGNQTQYVQSLTVSGTLSIGGGTLNTNGALFIETSPTNPFNITGGIFTALGNGLIFTSGLVGGTGSVNVPAGHAMNFSGPAAKDIAGNINIYGNAYISSSTSASIFLKEKGSLNVYGSLESKTTLDVIVDPLASFNGAANGSFIMNGGPSSRLNLQGSNINLQRWSVYGGFIQVVNKIISGALTMDSGSTLSLIGGPTEQRSFTSITGGNIAQQGGSSQYGSISGSALVLTGGSSSFSSQVNLVSLTLNGGTVTGGSINSQASTVSYAVFTSGSSLNTTSIDFRGLLTLQDDGTALTIAQNGQGRVTADSQINFVGASTLTINQGTVFNQGSVLSLSGSSKTKTPTFTHNGDWQSSSSLASNGVDVNGNGAFTIGNTADFKWTNANFQTRSLTSQGSFTYLSGTFNIGTVSGNGNFSGSPANFNAASFSANTFNLTDGAATLTKSNIQSSTLVNGNFAVASAVIGTFNLQGGIFSGSGSGATAKITQLNVQTVPAKTVQNLAVSTSKLSLQCGPNQCALFTINSSVSVVGKK